MYVSPGRSRSLSGVVDRSPRLDVLKLATLKLDILGLASISSPDLPKLDFYRQGSISEKMPLEAFYECHDAWRLSLIAEKHPRADLPFLTSEAFLVLSPRVLMFPASVSEWQRNLASKAAQERCCRRPPESLAGDCPCWPFATTW